MKLPTFVRGADGKFYQDLVYQDFPERRAWFVCFDPEEPAELVVRQSHLGDMSARDILRHRGFADCVRGIVNGRKTIHKRFFGVEESGKPVDGHDAVSWFLIFKKGVPLPTPNQYDSCVDIFPIFPNKAGVYFGDQR